MQRAPVKCKAGDPLHCCERPCARDAPAAVVALAPAAHYDVDVEVSCKAGRRLGKITYTESRPRGNR